MFAFALLQTLINGGILIAFGILIRKHFETAISLIIRKPIPEELVNRENYLRTMKLIELIGLLISLSGGIIILTGFVTWIYSLVH